MLNNTQRQRAEELIEAHWGYVEGVMRAHDASMQELKQAKFHYTTAALHFYGHAVEDTEVAIIERGLKEGEDE